MWAGDTAKFSISAAPIAFDCPVSFSDPPRKSRPQVQTPQVIDGESDDLVDLPDEWDESVEPDADFEGDDSDDA